MSLIAFDVADPPNAAKQSRLVRIDPWLLLAAVGLAACSLVAIYGATEHASGSSTSTYVQRQGVYFAIGFVLMLAVSRTDISRLRELKYALYAALLLAIIAVFVAGASAKGATRAIQLPFFSFQASELGKVLLVCAIAGFVVDRSRRIADRQTTRHVMLLALLPAALVTAQPDLGSGLVYVVIAMGVLLIAGTSWRHFVALFGLGAASLTVVLVAAPAVGVHVLKPYQVDRLTAFLSSTHDPQKQGYQQLEAKIAIGAGQKTGRGDANASQTNGSFVPENHTDFIFAVVGERFGFVGCATLLSLYALLIWRSLRIVSIAKTLFGTLVAGGLVAMMMFQVFVNVGMNLGMMPITGITLPLMSYGGSSVLTTFLALGLLQSIAVRASAPRQPRQVSQVSS